MHRVHVRALAGSIGFGLLASSGDCRRAGAHVIVWCSWDIYHFLVVPVGKDVSGSLAGRTRPGSSRAVAGHDSWL